MSKTNEILDGNYKNRLGCITKDEFELCSKYIDWGTYVCGDTIFQWKDILYEGLVNGEMGIETEIKYKCKCEQLARKMKYACAKIAILRYCNAKDADMKFVGNILSVLN